MFEEEVEREQYMESGYLLFYLKHHFSNTFLVKSTRRGEYCTKTAPLHVLHWVTSKKITQHEYGAFSTGLAI